MAGLGGNHVGEPKLDARVFLKLLIEIGPLVVFFLVNSRANVFWGTGAFMAATVVSLAASMILFGRVPTMPLISGAFIIVFGALTLWLQNDLFIKLKPTIVNVLFGSILLIGLAFKTSLLKHVLSEAFDLTDEGWRILTLRWALFFFVLAILNEIVWRNSSTDFWISFKAWGVMPLTMIFAMLQLGLIKAHQSPPSDSKP
jgi:intracellular septation protein